MSHYSPHFSKKEMRASATAARLDIDNTPPPEAEWNLKRLCLEVLEPLRARFGPLRITSGFRCPELNTAIGGSRTSRHVFGLAADLEPVNPAVTHREICDWLIAETEANRLLVDQVIYEYEDGWVHVGLAPEGKTPRGEALMIFRGTGYLPYNPADPRVR